MKKFGIILAFVLGITQIFAQDFEPNTHIFKYTRGWETCCGWLCGD